MSLIFRISRSFSNSILIPPSLSISIKMKFEDLSLLNCRTKYHIHHLKNLKDFYLKLRSIRLERSFNECGLSVASVLAKFLEPCVRSGSLHGQMLDMNMTFKNFKIGEILISAILLISTCRFQLSCHHYSHGRHFMQTRSWNRATLRMPFVCWSYGSLFSTMEASVYQSMLSPSNELMDTRSPDFEIQDLRIFTPLQMVLNNWLESINWLSQGLKYKILMQIAKFVHFDEFIRNYYESRSGKDLT